jgi:hypothetical protein
VTLVAYGLLGAVVAAALALTSLAVLQPVQQAVYDAFYLRVGPGAATETAILIHGSVAASAGATGSFLAGEYLSTRRVDPGSLGVLTLGVGGLLTVVLLAALARLVAFPTALLVLGAGFAGLALLLRYGLAVRSGGVPAFVGAVPVVVLLLVLAGVGLGWGWGYVVTAEEVPADSVTGEVATFDEVPQFERDLFAAGHCREEAGDRRTCSLDLRGYERAVAATRFMARHGVRCPYQGTATGREPASFVARHDGAYYRLACTPRGD